MLATAFGLNPPYRSAASVAGWKPGTFAARPRARVVSSSGSRGTRTHNGRFARTCFRGRLLIQPDDFRKAAVAGIEPAPRRLTAARPYQHEHHRTKPDVCIGLPNLVGLRTDVAPARTASLNQIKSGRPDLNRRSRAPEARALFNLKGARLSHALFVIFLRSSQTLPP